MIPRPARVRLGTLYSGSRVPGLTVERQQAENHTKIF